MKKNYWLAACMLTLVACKKEEPLLNNSNASSQNAIATSGSCTVTQPITVASFPKEVLPVDSGTIEFHAKLVGFDNTIVVGGFEPHFFKIDDGRSTFHMGFNANDGAGNGGLVGMAGSKFACGTGWFGNWTYTDVYGSDSARSKWHYYKFEWNRKGLRQFKNTQKKVAIYIDGKLNTTRWQPVTESNKTWYPLTAGTFNLITTGQVPGEVRDGWVVMDELKIFDGTGKLVLQNGLGSKWEIEHSKVGLNGVFNGFGNAYFVKGIIGNALIAKPVSSFNCQ